MMNNPNNNFWDIINLASLMVGLQNLNENREQSAHNDVEAANTRQAEYLLGEIHRLFEEQNRTIAKICAALEKLEETEKKE
jgi:UDP-N-acetylglucosamine 2-epimerase